LLAAN